MPLRQGEIYWIEDCPPLHGKVAAPHAVIILNPPEELKDTAIALNGMVVSSSIPKPGPEHIPMPNVQTHKPCSTCFSKPCWAVTGWILRITDRAKLGERCGYVGGKTLERVVLAFIGTVQAGTLPIDHPAKSPDTTPNSSP